MTTWLGLALANACAQCPDFSIEDLQTLLKTEPHLREDAIRRHGFDLHQQWTEKGGATFWRYNRCWYTTVSDRAFYDHVLLWNTSHNRFTFCTSNKAQYMRMLKSVESRHPGGNVAGTFVGKMFRYEFGLQTMDGLDYYAVTLSLRQ